jgi:hypothetical protein
LANTSSAQESLQGCTMHVIIFYIFFIIIIFIRLLYRHLHWKKYHLYQVHWHQHACGGSLGGAIHDLYGESTNKTSGRVWIALYVKKQLKVIFNIPRFTIAYENMTVFFVVFFQVHSIDLVDHYSWFLFCQTFMEQQIYMYFDRKVNLRGLPLQ